MKKSDQLKQQRASLLEAMGAVMDKAKGENRDLNTDEKTTFDAKQAELDALDADIKRAEQMEAVEARNAANNAAPVVVPSTVSSTDAGESRDFDKLMGEFRVNKAIQDQIEGRQATGANAEIQQEISKRAKDAGISMSGAAMPLFNTRAQTVTLDSGNKGGNLVQTDLGNVIDALRPDTVLERAGATVLRNLTGNLEFPVNQGGIAATWEGEIAEVAATDNTYGKIAMSPKRLASRVEISKQNIYQASIDLENYTRSEIMQQVAIALDRAGIAGAGTGNVPTGLLVAAGVNEVEIAANGGALTWEQIVALETAIMDSNYTGGAMSYILNSQTKGKLKTTKHEAGDATYLMGAGGELNGYNAYISNLMPQDGTKGSGTGLSAAVFGDFSQLLIGQWGFADMVVDPYTLAAKGMVALTYNTFADVLVKQPKAFARVLDIKN